MNKEDYISRIASTIVEDFFNGKRASLSGNCKELIYKISALYDVSIQANDFVLLKALFIAYKQWGGTIKSISIINNQFLKILYYYILLCVRKYENDNEKLAYISAISLECLSINSFQEFVIELMLNFGDENVVSKNLLCQLGTFLWNYDDNKNLVRLDTELFKDLEKNIEEKGKRKLYEADYVTKIKVKKFCYENIDELMKGLRYLFINDSPMVNDYINDIMEMEFEEDNYHSFLDDIIY